MMRRYNHKQTALTLTELLISSVIVAIVLMGVVSIDSVVAKKRQSSTADNLIALNARATVNHVLKNVVEAVGYGTEDHEGILIGSQVGDQQPSGPGSFCIEQDIAVGSNTFNQTPMDASDDRWVCYTFNPAEYNIYTCQKPYEALSAFRGAGRCATGEIVGQAISWDPQFSIEKGELGGAKLVFTLTLTNRFDPTKPKSTSNPETSVSISSSPPGHGIN